MTSQRGKPTNAVVEAAQADQISVNVPGSADIVGPPRVTFEDAVRDFAIEVLSAASYRETVARGSSSDEVQYTSAYFEGAKFEVRNAGFVRKTPWWHPWAKIVGPAAFVMTGVAIPLAFSSNPWPGWGFVAGGTFVVGLALAAMVEFVKGGDR